MGLVGVTIQNPTLNPPTDWSGLITDVLTYTVRRQINGAGSFSITMRASAQQVSQIRTGWKISLKEERIGANSDITLPEWILRTGRVLSRAYQIDDSGGGIFTVQGETWLGQFINNLIKTRQTFTGANLSTILSGLISNTGVTASHSEPLRTVSESLDIALNDQTLLANLIKLAELTRTNLRENWDADTWEFTDQDDLPAAGGMLTIGAGDLYLRQVEYADPKQAPNIGFGPGQYGVGIIQGIPTVSYDGKDIVNLVVGVGTEWDGSELSLDGATYFDAKYGVNVGLGGDGNPFWYIQDDDSIAAHGQVEFHLVRSDIKNPSNDPTTRAKAKAALLAVTSNELLRRRSETQTISVQVLNGAELGVLPGDRVHLRYKGNARMRGNVLTWLDVDQYFLVVARTDSGTANGIRAVVLDITAPTLVYTVPLAPNAVSIPTPYAPIFPHDPIPFDPGPPGGDYNTSLPPMPDPESMALDSYTPLVDMFKNLTEGSGAYQPCCADPTTDIRAGVSGPKGFGASPLTGYAFFAIGGGGSIPFNPTADGMVYQFTVVGPSIHGAISGGGFTWTQQLNNDIDGDGNYIFSLWSAPYSNGGSYDFGAIAGPDPLNSPFRGKLIAIDGANQSDPFWNVYQDPETIPNGSNSHVLPETLTAPLSSLIIFNIGYGGIGPGSGIISSVTTNVLTTGSYTSPDDSIFAGDGISLDFDLAISAGPANVVFMAADIKQA